MSTHITTITHDDGRKSHFPSHPQGDGTTIVDVRTLPTHGPMVLAFDANRLRKMGLAERFIEAAATSEPPGFVAVRQEGGTAK